MKPAIPHETWLKLKAAFREKPGNYRNAAKSAKVDNRTAKKAWLNGYPLQDPPRLPISQLLQQELAESDAKAAQIKTETEAFAAALRGDVRNEALDHYQRTTKMARSATVTANAALAAVDRLGPVVDSLAALAPALARKVQEAVENDDLSASECLIVLEKIANFHKTVTTTSNTATTQGARAVEVERLLKGDATQILGVKAEATEPITTEEAKRLAAELAEAVQESEAAFNGQPSLQVLSGGADKAASA